MVLEETIHNLFALIDSVVELYLGSIVKPFLKLHETFYAALNKILRKLLDDHRSEIPEWFTANWITYARTVLVVPTLLFLSWGYVVLPSLLVIFVDFGDFLDGVVARFWVDIRKEIEKKLSEKEKAPSPTNSDDESYEVVTTGSPQNFSSWLELHRNSTYGGFVDAVCDKAFVVPCWIALLNVVQQTNHVRWLQYSILFFLILAEVASGCIRFRAYFTSVAVPAPKVEGFDFSTSAVKADHVGKAKQTFEMVGTALFILPWVRYLGLAFLFLAVPLAYESVRRKITKRVLYVNAGPKLDALDHKTLKFWMQAKAMGSKLVVGFPTAETENDDNMKKAEMGKIFNALACSCVDEAVAEAPEKLDLMFLEKQKIDYVISKGSQPQFVTDEVVNAGRCLQIGEDGIVRLYKLKEAKKD
eukprot:CAMPEP_0172374080 /NCGR_PEP_ID=MMETSP1060-20121228/54357_1 /TAXON_ID=37318 /ORGANISM="Pseudo-nitzschia pungens, Strain cf. cingulata" /LENGTH=414 /DNA_ID=CAMNT_0013100617 /DNA_START=376 /DNA_END=1620 /DNA_ORIENTATION=+